MRWLTSWQERFSRNFFATLNPLCHFQDPLADDEKMDEKCSSEILEFNIKLSKDKALASWTKNKRDKISIETEQSTAAKLSLGNSIFLQDIFAEFNLCIS
jgi:hypothetical protein